ncbi:MAG: D-aminoacyl-tRNA deacylase [Pseudomonadota bacterium]
MIGLIQRAQRAKVSIEGRTVASIEQGLIVLVGFRQGDQTDFIPRFVQRLLNLRVFSDIDGKMNLSLSDRDGGLLLVPQFTLAADLKSGNRPGFSQAAAPEDGRALFEQLKLHAKERWPNSQFGVFGANMQVELVNDGPVTFWLETPPRSTRG